MENISQTIKEIVNEFRFDKGDKKEYKEPEISNVRQKEPFCPDCGCEVKIRTSFKGRTHYRTKRETQYCTSCNWSCILPTDHEACTQLGVTH